MKVRYLLLISLLIIGICIPAVSAEEYNIVLDDSAFYQQTSLPTDHTSVSADSELNCLWIVNANEIYGNELVTLYGGCEAQRISNYNDLPNFAATRVTIGDFMTGIFGYYKYQSLNDKSKLTDYLECYLIEIEYINDYPTGLTGKQRFLMVPDDPNLIFPLMKGYLSNDLSGDYSLKFAFGKESGGYPFYTYFEYNSVFRQTWQQNLIINTNDYYDLIELIRNGLASTIYIETPNLNFTNNPLDNPDYVVYLDALNDRPYLVSVHNPVTNRYFNYTVNLDGLIQDPGDPGDSTTLTVYIKNSQTGALIANSNIVIDALVNNEYYPVVNRSEPSGIFSIDLQPTGGGPPNPDGYRLIVTADGYNNPMPEINFTVDDYKQSIYCLLDPIAGGPADENKTFIDFFVSDMYANPVPGATVKFGKYTLITNSAGYTVFEVPKNDYYTYTVSKSGYNTITGNVNIGDAPRNTINTYLTPVITPPTQPTWPTDPPTQPTGGIPDEDDDSDGFLMESVRGIANLFGVSFGVGKNILGMLLALGIGTATAKHLRGGAQEFGMGMLGGVVLGVLIGLLPIWVLVLLVLIVGLWIGQRYMSGGDS